MNDVELSVDQDFQRINFLNQNEITTNQTIQRAYFRRNCIHGGIIRRQIYGVFSEFKTSRPTFMIFNSRQRLIERPEHVARLAYVIYLGNVIAEVAISHKA